MIIKTYSELIKLPSYDERFNYVKLGGLIGETTFGYDRYLNQQFYHSKIWRDLRHAIILRDNGCDLAIDGLDIASNIFIHHLNPITTEDIINVSDFLINPEYLVCMSFETHQALHFGGNTPRNTLVVRAPNDTCPWR